MNEHVNHPWWKIWISPKETIRNIVSTNRNLGIRRLSFAYGFVMCMNIARSMFLGSSYSAVTILVISIILALPLGYLAISISSGLFYISGKWFKGGASFHDVRAAVVWSNVPSIVTAILWIVLILSYGSNLFTQDFIASQVSKGHIFFIQATSILQLILGVWGLIIFFNAYAQVQGFSAWFSVVNLIVVMVMWFIILMLCVLVTYVLMKSTTVALIL